MASMLRAWILSVCSTSTAACHEPDLWQSEPERSSAPLLPAISVPSIAGARHSSPWETLAGGSGWVLLSDSPGDGKQINQWAADHCHTLAGGQPIFALDMCGHFYHIDYAPRPLTSTTPP